MGKMDLIPGHINKLAFTAEQVGYYWGQCAEFCGDSHANMQFKVIVEPEDQFNAWVEGWKAGPTQLSAQVAGTGDVTKAPAAMGICITCHQIQGTNLNIAPAGINEPAEAENGGIGPAKYAGPNLSLFGCRTYIAAGVLPNTPENLAKWLHDPGGIKPGNYMATQIKQGSLNDQQIAEIVGYLESLRPEGGCPPITGEVLPDHVASPVANETAVAEAIAAAESVQATSAAATAAASATAAAQPTQPPAQGGGGAQQPPPAASAHIDLVDIRFEPPELTIPANTDVTVTLTNKGATVHTFDIDQLNIHTGDIAPGATTEVKINAPAGDYQYYCAIPGHKEGGMVGTLHVVEGGGAPAGQGGGEQQAPPPGNGGGQAQAQEVDLVDIAFQPNTLTIPANTPVTINIVNKGAATHTFDIDALGINTGEVAPGASTTVTINAAPGQYEYYCAIPGHKQAGMVGTLTVQ
jgi:heme/copper-type cytochrome/quinol oxidase subunit 2